MSGTSEERSRGERFGENDFYRVQGAEQRGAKSDYSRSSDVEVGAVEKKFKSMGATFGCGWDREGLQT